MLIFKRTLIGLTVAFIVTAILSAATIIILMFTKATESGHYVGLFGSVFFDAHETDTGSTLVGIGVENAWALTSIFVVVFVVSVIFLSILSSLKKRKKLLQSRMDHAEE